MSRSIPALQGPMSQRRLELLGPAGRAERDAFSRHGAQHRYVTLHPGCRRRRAGENDRGRGGNRSEIDRATQTADQGGPAARLLLRGRSRSGCARAAGQGRRPATPAPRRRRGRGRGRRGGRRAQTDRGSGLSANPRLRPPRAFAPVRQELLRDRTECFVPTDRLELRVRVALLTGAFEWRIESVAVSRPRNYAAPTPGYGVRGSSEYHREAIFRHSVPSTPARWGHHPGSSAVERATAERAGAGRTAPGSRGSAPGVLRNRLPEHRCRCQVHRHRRLCRVPPGQSQVVRADRAQ